MQIAIIAIAIIAAVTLIITKTMVTAAQVRNYLAPVVVAGGFVLYYIGLSDAPQIEFAKSKLNN